ncbi:MAG: xanthine dehydrogenase family protein molybdopterin-binding subunit [Deltaproteobacteria bacterium]|nr:xanthine dehydrogenase family protein molybdopterin-binding subunit [Deltaproteobacteria bacterium]
MTQTYIGAPIRRGEDVRFLTGKATFIDDVKLPGMLYAAVLRSPHAHARIRSVDVSEALKLAGVVGVLTFADLPAGVKPIPLRMYQLDGLDRFLQYPLARGKVAYVGEPVALVAAVDRYVAEDGADLIGVEYEPLPVVPDVEAALRGDVVIHEEQGTNVAGGHDIMLGDVEGAFRDAEYTRKEVLRTHRHTGNPMETRGLVASWDAGRNELTVWGMTKVAHFNRAVLSSLLEMPEHRIHFVEPDVGGGFGIRGEFYPEDYLVPYAAMKLGRPVKWIEDRREHLMAANHSREVRCELEIAARKDGTLLGMRAHIHGDMGAHIRTHGGLVPASTAGVLPGPYRIPAYEAHIRCVMTNKMGVGTYRAPGRYESCYFRERMLDMVAGDLGMDPIDLRRKNLIQPEEIPYELGPTRPGIASTVFDSGDYPRALEHALERFGWDELQPLQGRKRDGRYHGIGIGWFVKNTGLGPSEGARIAVTGPESVAVYLGIATLGQGHETIMAQICADSLGVPMEWITVFHGHTDLMPWGGGTYSSRGTVMAGNAVHLTAQALKKRLLEVASRRLETDPAGLEFHSGKVHAAGTDQPLLGLGDLLEMTRPGKAPGDAAPGLEATEYFHNNLLTYTYGGHLVHVAVDPETGMVEILRYLVLEDVGRAVNPLLVHGQALGAAAQGIGGTLLEELAYNEDGQLLTTTLLDYPLPSATEIPPVESIITEYSPSPLNPLGVKGAGEGGIVACGAALANAVSHALSSLGIQIKELPLSPDRIRALVREAEQGG